MSLHQPLPIPMRARPAQTAAKMLANASPAPRSSHVAKVMDLHQRAGCQFGDGTSTFERDPNGSNLLLNFRGVSLAGDAASLCSRNHAILRHWARLPWLPKVSSGSIRQCLLVAPSDQRYAGVSRDDFSPEVLANSDKE